MASNVCVVLVQWGSIVPDKAIEPVGWGWRRMGNSMGMDVGMCVATHGERNMNSKIHRVHWERSTSSCLDGAK